MPSHDIDLTVLQAWVGRVEDRDDVVSLPDVQALAATLNWQAFPRVGTALPPLWHWTAFKPQARCNDLGEDGHPRLGGFLPPIPLPRRMWAGGRLRFLAELKTGEAISRRTEILRITQKAGSDGPLVFLTLKHTIANADGPAIDEEQDLVYRMPPVRSAVEPQAPGPVEPLAASWRDPVDLGPAVLFRYSALTFNAHRIHYDAPYATGVEGYRALVVQGPLIATLLIDRLVAHTGGRVVAFEFRGQRPLHVSDDARFCGSPVEGEADCFNVWAETPDGSVAMSGRARIALV